MVKNLSQLKKSLVIGSHLQIVENAIKPYHNGEIREIVKIQTNNVKTKKPDDSMIWLDWQKAKNMRFNKDNSIDFLVGEEMRDEWLIEQQKREGKDYWLKIKIINEEGN